MDEENRSNIFLDFIFIYAWCCSDENDAKDVYIYHGAHYNTSVLCHPRAAEAQNETDESSPRRPTPEVLKADAFVYEAVKMMELETRNFGGGLLNVTRQI